MQNTYLRIYLFLFGILDNFLKKFKAVLFVTIMSLFSLNVRPKNIKTLVYTTCTCLRAKNEHIMLLFYTLHKRQE